MLYQKSENGWELHTTANGHLSCDNFVLKADDTDRVEELLRPKYGKIMKKSILLSAMITGQVYL